MRKRLCGGYIQLWPNNGLINHAVWEKVLHEMNDLGMDTAIIQFMDTADGIKLDEAALIAEIILKYAQQNHIKVFLGLYGPPQGELGSPISVEPDKLNISKAESIRVAEELKRSFSMAQPFYGWHLPLESWTGEYSNETITNLNGYYKELTAQLKVLLPDKKVLISPYINSGRTTPERTREIYTEILHDTRIDFLALQDGVGAKYICVDDDKLPFYFREMCAACTEKNIEMWGNAESFAIYPSSHQLTAAEPERFIKQIELAQGASRIVTFDFFHYMNNPPPLPNGTSRPPGYKAAVSLLNSRYRAWLQQEQTVIADGGCHS